MTPEEFYARSCEGKIRHPTEEAARVSIHTSTKHKACSMNAYGPCGFCEGWHVGHRKGTAKHCGGVDEAFDAAVKDWVQRFGTQQKPEEGNNL